MAGMCITRSMSVCGSRSCWICGPWTLPGQQTGTICTHPKMLAAPVFRCFDLGGF